MISPLRKVLFLLCLSANLLSAPSLAGKDGCITFLLDFCGADDSGGGYFAAEFQGWDPVPMCDFGGGWQITFCNIDPGTYQYKFLNGPGGWEFMGFGDVCTNPADNENRFVDISGGCDIEGPWCWSQCVMGSGSQADDVAPQITGDVPEDITISCPDDLPDMELLEAGDECAYGCTSEWPEDDLSGLDACGLGEIIRTWRVIDCAGNEGTPVSQSIFVQDFEAPRLSDEIDDITVVCGGEIPEGEPLEAEDECDENVFQTFDPVDDFSGLDPDGTGDIIRTWYVEDCRGNFEEYRQVITITPPVPLIHTGTLCGDSAYIYTDEYDAYTWEYIASDGGVIDLMIDNDTLYIDSSGVYILTAMQGGCTVQIMDTFELVPGPTYELEDGVACSESATGNSTVNLLSLISYNPEDSLIISDISGTELNDFTLDFDGQMPGTAALLIDIYTDSICPPVRDTLYIAVVDCSCPEVPDFGDVCVGDNIDTLDLAAIKPAGFTGNWFINPVEPGIRIEDDLLIINPGITPGDYNLLFVFDDPDVNNNCSSQSPAPNISRLTLIAEDIPELASDQVTACNGPGAEMSVTELWLDSLVTDMRPGTWSSNHPEITIDPDNLIDFTGVAEGSYILTFIQGDNIHPCPASNLQLEVLVLDCMCPLLRVFPDTALCNNMATVDLNDLIISGTGDWRYLEDGPVPDLDVRDDRYFDIANILPGIYTLEFSTDDSLRVSGCDSIAQVQIEIFQAPAGDVLVSDTSICNSDNPMNEPFTLDLETLLSPGTSAGKWNAPGFSGDLSDPSQVDFSDVEPGVYTFIYETDTDFLHGGLCEEILLTLDVNVQECRCPALPEVMIADVCQTGDTLFINELTAPEAEGNYMLTGQGGTEVLLGNYLVPSEYPEGDFTLVFAYEASVIPEVCTGASASFEFSIIAPPDPGIPSEISVCDRAGSSIGAHILDFTEISAGVQGDWISDPAFQGNLSDLASVDFSGMAGDTFTFTFVTDEPGNPCPPMQFDMEIQVQDCGCPGVGINSPGNLCGNGLPVNLESLLEPGSGEGVFSILTEEDELVAENITILDPRLLNPDAYILRFTLNETVPPGCATQAEFPLEIIPPAEAGAGSTAMYCADTEESVELGSLLSMSNPGGHWNQTAGMPLAFDPEEGVVDLAGLMPGTYGFEYIVPGNGPCPADTSESFIIINDLPGIEAGADQEINCEDASVILGTSLIMDPTFTYIWSDSNGIRLNPGGETEIEITTEGKYFIQLTDGNGCQTIDSVEVIDISEVPVAEYELTQPPCYNDSEGILDIISIAGGNGIYNIILQGQLSDTLQLTGMGAQLTLPIGQYELHAESGACISPVETFTIENPQEFGVDIGPSQLQVTLGESQSIMAVLQGISNADISNVIWKDQDDLILCEGMWEHCHEVQVLVTEPMWIYGEITSSEGCIAADSIQLIPVVNSVTSIYVPNVIDASAFDDNRYLRVYAGEWLSRLEYYGVYDRWGNLVYERPEGIDINAASEAWWSGMNNGHFAEQGVYLLMIAYRETSNPGVVVHEAFSVLLIR